MGCAGIEGLLCPDAQPGGTRSGRNAVRNSLRAITVQHAIAGTGLNWRRSPDTDGDGVQVLAPQVHKAVKLRTSAMWTSTVPGRNAATPRPAIRPTFRTAAVRQGDVIRIYNYVRCVRGGAVLRGPPGVRLVR